MYIFANLPRTVKNSHVRSLDVGILHILRRGEAQHSPMAYTMSQKRRSKRQHFLKISHR